MARNQSRARSGGRPSGNNIRSMAGGAALALAAAGVILSRFDIKRHIKISRM